MSIMSKPSRSKNYYAAAGKLTIVEGQEEVADTTRLTLAGDRGEAMIAIKNSRELALMKEACVISARALKLAGEAVEPGVTTGEIDRIIRKYIESQAPGPLSSATADFPPAPASLLMKRSSTAYRANA